MCLAVTWETSEAVAEAVAVAVVVVVVLIIVIIMAVTGLDHGVSDLRFFKRTPILKATTLRYESPKPQTIRSILL